MSKPKYHLDGVSRDWHTEIQTADQIVLRVAFVTADRDKSHRWYEEYLDDLEAATMRVGREDLRDELVAVRVWWELGE